MNHTLQQELIERAGKNHHLRSTDEKTYQEWLKVIETDQANTLWLKGIVTEYGWPTQSSVGKEAAQSARMIAHHSGDNLFMKRCLKLMEPLIDQGEVEQRDYAFLMDRYLISQGKKQLYGTQGKSINGKIVPWPIQDEKRVDERRSAFGLRPLADYFRRINT